MKKSILPPETEHNVDILQRNLRSDGNGRGNQAIIAPQATGRAKSTIKPTPPARSKIVVDSEGFRTVTRRSPRSAFSSDEDRDFQPEVWHGERVWPTH